MVALEDLTEHIEAGDTVIVDGNHGVVIVSPDEDTLQQYKKYITRNLSSLRKSSA